MTNDILTPELTSDEFKAQFIGFIQDRHKSPELLRKLFDSFPDDKKSLLEEYRVDTLTEAVVENKQEWLRRPRYFDEQAQMAKQNFSQKRIEHLIEVKSYLIEQGIDGFTLPKADTHLPQNSALPLQEHSMSKAFTSINLDGFQPSRPFANSVNSGDLSKVRMALFMEMNDKQLSNQFIRQTIAWTLKQKLNLFVPYEENGYAQAMNQDTSQWSADYYGLQEVYASSNFSEKRISHMLAVRERVFTIKERPASASPSSPQQRPQTRPYRQDQGNNESSHEGSGSGNNSIWPLILIGGALAVVAAVLLAKIIR